ncbi:TNF receptor-associated factor 4-like [Dendronephthya gigantea]|uniref:TNF receptor-associated factor 4-like n=1 Tax=Dendronephthya gigantea TaxID=151771 RepID=UPI00106BBF3F|nr:TNF receptor-associated factor 4-like [Dendronephthya gigantea]
MSGPKLCPKDKKILREHEIFRDRNCERQIVQRLCFCSCEERGFTWSGPFELLEAHEAICPYMIISCPKECGRKLPRRKIHEHFSRDCPLAIGSCPMDQCDFQGRSRAELRKHLEESNVEHIYMLQDTIHALRSKNAMLQAKLSYSQRRL